MDLHRTNGNSGGRGNVQEHNQQQGQLMLRDVQLRQNMRTPAPITGGNELPQHVVTSSTLRQFPIPGRAVSGSFSNSVRMGGARQYGPQHFAQIQQRGTLQSQLRASYVQQLPIHPPIHPPMRRGQENSVSSVQLQPRQTGVQQNPSTFRSPSTFPVNNPNQGGLVFQQQLQGGYRMTQQPKEVCNSEAVALQPIRIWRACAPNQQLTNPGQFYRCSHPHVPDVPSHTVTFVHCPNHFHTHSTSGTPSCISGGARHPQYPPGIVMPAPIQQTLRSPCQVHQTNHVIHVVTTRTFDMGGGSQPRHGDLHSLEHRSQVELPLPSALTSSLGHATPLLPAPLRGLGTPDSGTGTGFGNNRMQQMTCAEQARRRQPTIVTGYGWGGRQEMAIRREGVSFPSLALGGNHNYDGNLVISSIGHDDDNDSNESDRLFVDTSRTVTASEEEEELEENRRPTAPVMSSDEDGDDDDVDENGEIN